MNICSKLEFMPKCSRLALPRQAIEFMLTPPMQTVFNWVTDWNAGCVRHTGWPGGVGKARWASPWVVGVADLVCWRPPEPSWPPWSVWVPGPASRPAGTGWRRTRPGTCRWCRRSCSWRAPAAQGTEEALTCRHASRTRQIGQPDTFRPHRAALQAQLNDYGATLLD